MPGREDERQQDTGGGDAREDGGQEEPPLFQRILDLVQHRELPFHPVRRLPDHDGPGEPREARGDRLVERAAGSPGERGQLVVAGDEPRRIAALQSRRERFSAVEADPLLHDAGVRVPGARIGDEPVLPVGDLHVSLLAQGLLRMVGGALDGAQGQDRLEHPQGSAAARIVDAQAQRDGPDRGGLVVFDPPDVNPPVPRLLPPAFVALEHVGRRVGGGDVQAVDVGEERLGKIRGGVDEGAQAPVGLGKCAECLFRRRPGFEGFGAENRQPFGLMALRPVPCRVDDQRVAAPATGVGDPFDDVAVDGAGELLGLPDEVAAFDALDEGLPRRVELLGDDVQAVAHEEPGGETDDGHGDPDAGEGQLDQGAAIGRCSGHDAGSLVSATREGSIDSGGKFR